jgi:hypothetical protein
MSNYQVATALFGDVFRAIVGTTHRHSLEFLEVPSNLIQHVTKTDSRQGVFLKDATKALDEP